MKSLLSMPVGKRGKPLLEEIIRQFGHEAMDYVLFVYDDERFDEEIFAPARVIYQKSTFPIFKWGYIQEHLTPAYCAPYEYVFMWDDDIRLSETFSLAHFLELLKTYTIEMAQPALTPDSYYSHEVTVQRPNSLGRYTNFVEVMAPVFSSKAWPRYWKMLRPYNPGGFFYDYFAMFGCGFQRVAVIDCEPVTHTRPVGSHNVPSLLADGERFRAECWYVPDIRQQRSYGQLGQLSLPRLSVLVSLDYLSHLVQRGVSGVLKRLLPGKS